MNASLSRVILNVHDVYQDAFALSSSSTSNRKHPISRTRVFPSSGTLHGRKSETSDLRAQARGQAFGEHAFS